MGCSIAGPGRAGESTSVLQGGCGTSMSKTRSLEISGGEQEGHAETAPEDCQRKMYEELKELEEQRAKEALVLVQKKHKLIKWEGERERAKGPCKDWM